jgi:hypothetical protein
MTYQPLDIFRLIVTSIIIIGTVILYVRESTKLITSENNRKIIVISTAFNTLQSLAIIGGSLVMPEIVYVIFIYYLCGTAYHRRSNWIFYED